MPEVPEGYPKTRRAVYPLFAFPLRRAVGTRLDDPFPDYEHKPIFAPNEESRQRQWASMLGSVVSEQINRNFCEK